MINIFSGIVTNIVSRRDGISFIEVTSNEEKFPAINYDDVTGKVEIGDEVFLNRTARLLNLGTGGYDFVIANTRYKELDMIEKGHIMKLRYTPGQINVLAIEEQDSPYHHIFDEFKSLNRFPVIIGELHSMVAPVSIVLKKILPDVKITYIMTDSAGLPIKFSNIVYELKQRNIINSTITAGHAFGGDFEAVNIFTALIGAKEIAKSDIAIIAMGPGIVGTGTKFGFSGIDQAYIIDAVNKLGGVPILIPRIGFGDKRERHYGISHHTVTILNLCNSSCTLTFPIMSDEKMDIINRQIKENNIFSNFEKVFIDASITKVCIEESNLKVTTMGRDYYSEPEFFDACGAAAIYSSKYLI